MSGIIKYLALGSSYYFGDYELFKNALSCVNKGLSHQTAKDTIIMCYFIYTLNFY